MKTVTKRLRVYGIVQGVGFRPTVSRHAMKNEVFGSVSNKGPYVEIYVQGNESAVESFIEDIKKHPPKRAAILKINIEEIQTEKKWTDFAIIESEKTVGEIFISPDIAICEECKEELYDPDNRRYLHPFINCTCCGPRLTILDALPYDRERTSMKAFPMCPDCEKEYHDPATRRYDAQPVCCNECGPEVYLIGRKERGRDAILYTRKVIREGGIAAIKGIGGFHLCCSAENEEAVALLRSRKKRPMKPFAVMARDLETVQRECEITKEQTEILTGHQKPILLLPKKEGSVQDGTKLAPSVAPDNPNVGVMLPYAPVQLLLFDYDDGASMPDVLVMTSGNTSGAPICRSDEDAVSELSKLCDCILSHDRAIRIRADDTVTDFYKKEPYMIRRSRGYAPLPFMMTDIQGEPVLAIGGELKNSFCLGVDGRFYLSPYIGDLEDLRTVKALKETVGRMATLLELEPKAVACDLHPKYHSCEVAEQTGLPIIRVQHHYAHILSCMAENDFQDPVIGVSFDGTGYGADGTVWGGEILYADLNGFERSASITPFLQIGGDVSAREGWRIAVSILYQMTGDKKETTELVKQLELCGEQECNVLMTMADRRINAVESTSAGRLFDAVSAILGIRRSSTFEGEASMSLQFAAQAYEKRMTLDGLEDGVLSLEKNKERLLLPTNRLAEEIAKRKLKGEDPEKLAYLFHKELAREIVSALKRVREDTGCTTVALSGGVFQNTLLLKMTDELLTKENFAVLRHRLIPPNDGGIALGQCLYAMVHYQKKGD